MRLLGALEDVEGADLDPALDGMTVRADDRPFDRPAGVDLEIERDFPGPGRGVDLGQNVLVARRAPERVGLESPGPPVETLDAAVPTPWR